MFAIKVKRCINEKVIFEVLTRSPFIKKDFCIDEEDFNKVFRETKQDMIETNVLNSKANIYKCISKIFIGKLYWWNENIYEVDFLYTSVYKKDGDNSIKIVQMDIFNSYMYSYINKFKSNYPEFLKDLSFFRSLFDSA